MTEERTNVSVLWWRIVYLSTSHSHSTFTHSVRTRKIQLNCVWSCILSTQNGSPCSSQKCMLYAVNNIWLYLSSLYFCISLCIVQLLNYLYFVSWNSCYLFCNAILISLHIIIPVHYISHSNSTLSRPIYQHQWQYSPTLPSRKVHILFIIGLVFLGLVFKSQVEIVILYSLYS